MAISRYISGIGSDAAMAGSMARTRNFIVSEWLVVVKREMS